MLPKKQGLYSPDFEHDNCGAGFICSLQGKKTNDIIGKALDILVKLEHRGAVSSDGKTGDGAGILIEIPHDFLVKNVDFDLNISGDIQLSKFFEPIEYSQNILESESLASPRLSVLVIALNSCLRLFMCSLYFFECFFLISAKLTAVTHLSPLA